MAALAALLTTPGFWFGCAVRCAADRGFIGSSASGGGIRCRDLLDDLIVWAFGADCPWRDEPRGICGARFSDQPPRRPPDMPARAMRVIAGGNK